MNAKRTKREAPPTKSEIARELDAAGPRANASTQPKKKNYAEALSKALATKVANSLRKEFPGILPNPDGSGQESRARTAKGVKKLDVNYSTPELGLGLGLSIKTINFRDPKTKRYTKNYTRVDNELRAEAHDYHERQPFAVMIALVFLPADACADGKNRNPSSFAAAVDSFRWRAGRRVSADHHGLFEGLFLGLYEPEGIDRGATWFFDVTDTPPIHGTPERRYTWAELVERVTAIYDARNYPKKVWLLESERVG
jgi:hypothetical protein